MAKLRDNWLFVFFCGKPNCQHNKDVLCSVQMVRATSHGMFSEPTTLKKAKRYGPRPCINCPTASRKSCSKETTASPILTGRFLVQVFTQRHLLVRSTNRDAQLCSFCRSSKRIYFVTLRDLDKFQCFATVEQPGSLCVNSSDPSVLMYESYSSGTSCEVRYLQCSSKPPRPLPQRNVIDRQVPALFVVK